MHHLVWTQNFLTGRGWAYQDGTETSVARPDYHRWVSGQGGYNLLTLDPGANFGGIADANSGHFLVRTVPEPSTALLVAMGLAGLAGHRRR